MTTYSAFINDNGTAVPFPGVPSPGGAASTVQVVVSTSRSASITSFDTPPYVVGSHELQVFLNGLLCIEGTDYTETSSGKITFSSSIGKNEHIAAIVTNGQDPVQVAVSQSRPTAIASGGAYDVPEHTVGGNKLQVFIDGLLITPTIDYQEISQTQIVFNDSVPADRQIVIYRR